eukprot:GHVR01139553.1.p1 GENE.GHVR01139553.1~~GHVR01139553.1.p1  ORF type:complete len:199 (+),score=63.73 GHVR01139553.1:73-669(+)
MTTAHRPTWAPAMGGDDQCGNKRYVPSTKTSARDLTSQTSLKHRQTGQFTLIEASRTDFKRELEEREARALADKRLRMDSTSAFEARVEGDRGDGDRGDRGNTRKEKLALLQQELAGYYNPFPEDADDEVGVPQDTKGGGNKKGGATSHATKDDESSSHSDDSDDDEALLHKELEKLKQERIQEENNKERLYESVVRN